METNELELKNEAGNVTPSSLPTVLKVIAYLNLVSGVFLAFILGFERNVYYRTTEFNGGIFLLCIIYAIVACCILLGFAKIVEAADKYLQQ